MRKRFLNTFKVIQLFLLRRCYPTILKLMLWCVPLSMVSLHSFSTASSFGNRMRWWTGWKSAKLPTLCWRVFLAGARNPQRLKVRNHQHPPSVVTKVWRQRHVWNESARGCKGGKWNRNRHYIHEVNEYYDEGCILEKSFGPGCRGYTESVAGGVIIEDYWYPKIIEKWIELGYHSSV